MQWFRDGFSLRRVGQLVEHVQAREDNDHRVDDPMGTHEVDEFDVWLKHPCDENCVGVKGPSDLTC